MRRQQAAALLDAAFEGVSFGHGLFLLGLIGLLFSQYNSKVLIILLFAFFLFNYKLTEIGLDIFTLPLVLILAGVGAAWNDGGAVADLLEGVASLALVRGLIFIKVSTSSCRIGHCSRCGRRHLIDGLSLSSGFII